jgi:hypothetical protein
MNRIIQYIKCLNGNIFGGYVRDRYTNSPFVDLDCRLDKENIDYLLNLLSLDYEVSFNPASLNYKRWNVVSYFITPKLQNSQFSILKLDILLCNSITWSTYPCDFDVNLLVESNDSLCVRQNHAGALKHFPDQLNTILRRCRNKQFAIVALPRGGFQDVFTILLRAKSLVERGWYMDDIYLGQTSFIMNTWKSIHENIERIRTKYSKDKMTITQTHNECALCREQFKDTDIIFNTTCNHNFHWTCNASVETKGGLHHWFLVKEAYSCPICRQDALNFSFL